MLRLSAPPFRPSQACAGGRPPQTRVLSHLPYPYVPHAWIRNPVNGTWFTEGESKLICAILLHIRRAGPRIQNLPFIHPYTYQMVNEIMQNIRNVLLVPWKYEAINCAGLQHHIKNNANRAIRRLWYTARDDESGFWRGRAKLAFRLWVVRGSPLVNQLRNTGELARYNPQMGPNAAARPPIISGPPNLAFIDPGEPADRNLLMIRRRIEDLLGQKAAVDHALATGRS